MPKNLGDRDDQIESKSFIIFCKLFISQWEWYFSFFLNYLYSLIIISFKTLGVRTQRLDSNSVIQDFFNVEEEYHYI